jgi:hypothetical protein
LPPQNAPIFISSDPSQDIYPQSQMPIDAIVLKDPFPESKFSEYIFRKKIKKTPKKTKKSKSPKKSYRKYL